ncbi:MAG TPA: signal recognition particle-docking protein FtsY [Dehalococcoidales bacterium]|nr:signal recognition particle-docking protein FtsY [Dehalococcoidales bacterium]
MFKNLFKKALQPTKDSWFSKAMRLFDRPGIDDAIWDELVELMIAADVGMETAEKLIQHTKQRVKQERLKDGAQVREVLKDEMIRILDIPYSAPQVMVSPRVVLVIGVNGSGKTTSIAKLAFQAKNEGKTVILAAADTFRAAAIDQLQTWAKRAGVDVIAHQPGADPGAVVYDAMAAAKTRQADILIIDTAGRLHTKFNLMEELKKIKKVTSRTDTTAPHDILLVLDATTGQNGLAQAKSFTEATGINGIFLSKLDGTAKGGIALAICDQLKIPVRFVGTGEHLEDIETFNARAFVEALSGG